MLHYNDWMIILLRMIVMIIHLMDDASGEEMH